MEIAYLVNCYPTVSHSFIRREIVGVEAAGGTVRRYSVRRPHGNLPDERDRAELRSTIFILDRGVWALMWATLCMAFGRPRSFLPAFGLSCRNGGSDVKRLVRHLAYLVEACWLARDLGDIAHIHAHFGTNPAAVARLVHRLTGKSFSFTAHGPDEFDAPVALALGGKCADADLVCAISDYGRSQLMRWSDPKHWPKIDVVRCGVDDMFLEDNAAPDYASRQLCCVARLSAQKGIPLLIEAAARVLVTAPDLRLVLVGDGERRDEIERSIAQSDIANRVTITGFVDAATVRRIMLSSCAMILPSFAEGLPVVIMEALALRLPVITTYVAGNSELADDECGWLVPAGSIDALADAMTEAMCAPESLLRSMGEVGRARVLARHNAATNATRLYSLIRSSAS